MRSVEIGTFGEENHKLVLSNGIHSGLNDQSISSNSMLDTLVRSCDLDGMVGC